MKSLSLIAKLGLVLLFCCTFQDANAQFQLGLQGGRNFAEGDIHCWEHPATKPWSPTGGALGGYLKYKKADRCLGARLNFAYLPLKFDESKYGNPVNDRGYTSTNKAKDLSVELMYHLLCKKRLQPYIFGGIGAQFAKQTVNWNDFDLLPSLAPLTKKDDEAGSILPILPVGAGLQYRLSQRLLLHGETSLRLPINDYIDGISQAANPGANDWHGYAMVGLSYLLKGEPDQDKDGISDKKDKCPNQAGLKQFEGCPDTDMDGITDMEDRCPTDKGAAATKGCPDRDMDTVVDIDDTCPDAAGLVAMKGCPDADGDGIADADDTCPQVKGLAIMKGCPDTDGDGVADAEDGCPEKAGLKTNKGCPVVDTDGDGIADAEDKCPLVAGSRSNGGCAEIVPVVTPTPVVNDVPVVADPTATRQACTACYESTDPIFTSVCNNPKKLSRLGSNPEFGNSHGLTPTEFYEKLKRAYGNNKIDRVFLDRIYRLMGYSGGFADATADQFTEVELPVGSTGKLGYAKTHQTGCYTLPDDAYHRQAFHIRSANGCDLHFMKTCGNHFFMCGQ
jgi:Domain of unknown function (DUF6089)/Thrombospondin type 3 repeat